MTDIHIDPDLQAYRAAGIPDNALPSSSEEAERWRQLAAVQKQPALRIRAGTIGIYLVPPGAVTHDGIRSQPYQWEPRCRRVFPGK